MPRMRSTTRRAFMGVTRMYRAWALASMVVPSVSVMSLFRRSATTRLTVVLLVAAEGAGRRELAELVADHRLGDEHRDVLAAVVHRDRVAEHGRDDHRAAGPGLDDVLGAGFVLRVHLLDEVVVDEGPLLETTRHLNPLLALLVRLAAADDVLVAGLLRRASTALLLTPRRDRVATTGGLALTTTVRVVDGVHDHTTNGRADALPAHAAGLAPVDVRLLGVADLADGGAAADVDQADLTGRHTEVGHGALLRQQLHGGTRGAGELRATAGPQLDRVERGTDRDVAQRQVVAGLDVGAGAVLDPVALLQATRREDVALLAVHVVQQRDARGAVRVVLDVRDLRRDAVLVMTTEVDHAVRTLVTATLVADRDATGVVTTALAVQRADQRLLRRGPRDLDEVGDAGATTPRGRRLVLADTHFSVLGIFRTSGRFRPPSGGRAAEDVDTVALGKGHDGALGVLALAVTGAGALALALPVDRVDPGDLDREDRLDGLLDLGLVRARVDDERVLVLVQQRVALLRDHRRDENVAGVREGLAGDSGRLTHQAALPSVFSAALGPATKDSKAALVKTTSSETSTSYVFSWPGSRMCTWGRLRADSHAASSLRSATSSTCLRSLILPSRAFAALVEMSPSTTPVTT